MVRNRWSFVRSTAALLALAAGSNVRATTYWQENPATPDDWFDYFAWSAGIPNSSNSAYIGNGGTATISYGDAIASGVYLGYSSANSGNNSSSGTIAMTGGQLSCGNSYIYVGYSSGTTGTFNQSGGQVTAEDLDIASYNSAASGLYQLSGTGQLVTQYEYIGYPSNSTNSLAQFIQTGGTNSVSSTLYLGEGSYSLSSNSTLTAYGFQMAQSSGTTATFTQAGGTVQLENTSCYIGYDGSATYSMTAGASLTTNNGAIYLGDYSTSSGTLNITDSTVSIGTAPLYVGYSGSVGTLTMSGNSQLNTSTQYIGDNSRATFTQNGGTNNLGTSYLYVAYGSNSNATYTLGGTGVLLSGNQYIGGSSTPSVALFNQTGGTNNLGNYNLYVGNNATATYNLSSSAMLTAANEYVSSSAIAIFNQTGGLNVVAPGSGSYYGNLGIGNNNGQTGSGQYYLSGGQLSASTETIGASGTGSTYSALLDQTGGSNAVVTLTNNSTGRYNLLQGILTISKSFTNNGVFDMQNPASVGIASPNTLTLTSIPITGTGSLIVDPNATLYASSITQSSLTIGGKVQIVPNSSTSVVNSLTLTGGTLDITNNAMVVDYTSSTNSPLSAIRGYLRAGYTSGQAGPGIISSTAAGNVGVAIGYAENSDLDFASFGNVSVDTTAVLMRYTWFGDANLDGVVNSTDLAMMQSNGTTWDTGDFNYDGQVNSDDYALFDLGAALGGTTVIPFPEPASVAMLLAIPVLMRRPRSASTGHRE